MLDWLYTAISWVMLRWHDLFVLIGLPKDGGLSWALSIMFLVITLRILMFRFFVKQVKTQRAMQELQPKIQAIRQKYKDDRQTMSREIMALQQEAGVNMLAGCLPILLQAPVFISLFHVLKYISPTHPALYSWTTEEMISAGKARLFGAPIAVGFNSDPARLAELGGNQTATRIVALVLIVCMVVATYLTQRMIMNRSTAQADPQQQMIQKLMLYGMPASLAVSGFFFPIGILVYWFTNNIWTLGQQFYILRKMPMKTATGAEKTPRVENKARAPKPGAKPLHPKNRRSQLTAGADAHPSDGTERSTVNGSTTTGGASARPAAKGTPAKAAGKTPPAKAAGTAKASGKAAKTTGAASGDAAATTARVPGRKPNPAGKGAATNPDAPGTTATGGSANAGSADGASDGTASEGAGAQSGSPNGAKRTPAKSSGNRSSASRKRRR